jgi:putative transcriptional regulator
LSRVGSIPILAAMGEHSGKPGGEAEPETGIGQGEAREDGAPPGESGFASLTNHLLIAMPSLSDPNFSQTVALICEHTDRGALGIVLNKPLPMRLSDVLSQMQITPASEIIAAQPVLRGGPVHTDRGFVLHRPGGQWDHTHKVSDTFQVTTSRDVLAAMARGEGPQDAFIALGYAGWESGQLVDLGAGRCPRRIRAAVPGALERRLGAARGRCRTAQPDRRTCLSRCCASWPSTSDSNASAWPSATP